MEKGKGEGLLCVSSVRCAYSQWSSPSEVFIHSRFHIFLKKEVHIHTLKVLFFSEESGILMNMSQHVLKGRRSWSLFESPVLGLCNNWMSSSKCSMKSELLGFPDGRKEGKSQRGGVFSHPGKCVWSQNSVISPLIMRSSLQLGILDFSLVCMQRKKDLWSILIRDMLERTWAARWKISQSLVNPLRGLFTDSLQTLPWG